ncbi:MAG: outer membrane protein assembly factor BamB [Limisphaerales bacterium]|jgi:outer membrane protein assembly factor BamB
MNLRHLSGLILLGGFAVNANAADWPQFLGPERNGKTTGEGLAVAWPKEGPPVVWQKKAGQGFAGPVVKGGHVILFHRLGDMEVIERLNAADGKQEWTYDYPSVYRDGYSSDYGPRSVPTIDGGRVYSLGADGAIRCVDFTSGKEIWSEEARENFGAEKGFFGMAGSPLIEGDSVLLNIGGRDGAGVIALSKNTGKLLWKATDQEADYSSPTVATIHGKRQALIFLREGLVGLDPKNGKILYQFRWRARIHASVNAALPVVVGNRILLTSSYDTGDNLLEIDASNKLTSVWSGDSFSSQYATPMHKGGFLYGLSGRHDSGVGTSPRCVELATGKVLWTQDGLKASAMIMAGEHLVVLTERGELIRMNAKPDKAAITGRAQILGSGARAQPALADGKLFARDSRRLVCLELTEPK